MTAIARKSQVSGRINTLDMRVTEREILEWRKSGSSIQNYFPDLNDGEREFILTGTTEEEWDTLLADDEE